VSRPLFRCTGGSVLLPAERLVLVDAGDGGNLVVEPPRPVWERSQLTPGELTLWSFLVAATGRAMIDALPQLAGGCVNYWEAGNWALHDAAAPVGAKSAPEHRRVHLHLLGRSPRASDPAFRWGEAPGFPAFADRHRWAAGHRRLAASECHAVVTRLEQLLRERYGLQDAQIEAVAHCPQCGYPLPAGDLVEDAGEGRGDRAAGRCADCRAEG
jgi:hypothetical protein